MNKRWTSWLMVVALSGCVIQGNRYPRPRDLEPSWLAARPRLLAIQADPPDILPGEASTLRALFADPNDELRTFVWIGCADEALTSFGCVLDPSALSPDATAEDLERAGVIGIEPFFSPSIDAPLDYLDELDDRGQRRGRALVATVIGLTETALEDEGLDFNEIRVGFKRVMVTTREPNQNPSIEAFLVDENPWPEDTPFEVAPGETVELDLTLGEDAIEAYTYLNLDGEWEEREEQPFAEWYTSDGRIERSTTIHPFLFSRWVAPNEPDVEGSWWVVVKDRRGGISWAHRRWRTTP
jgi:hypothetical protein